MADIEQEILEADMLNSRGEFLSSSEQVVNVKESGSIINFALPRELRRVQDKFNDELKRRESNASVKIFSNLAALGAKSQSYIDIKIDGIAESEAKELRLELMQRLRLELKNKKLLSADVRFVDTNDEKQRQALMDDLKKQDGIKAFAATLVSSQMSERQFREEQERLATNEKERLLLEAVWQESERQRRELERQRELQEQQRREEAERNTNQNVPTMLQKGVDYTAKSLGFAGILTALGINPEMIKKVMTKLLGSEERANELMGLAEDNANRLWGGISGNLASGQYEAIENHPGISAATLSQIQSESIAEYIKRNEGYQENSYKDTTSRSVGYGFLKTSMTQDELALNGGKFEPMNKEAADKILALKISKEDAYLSQKYDFYNNAPDEVKKVMLDMSYNMGRSNLNKQTDLLNHLSRGEYKEAARHIDAMNRYKKQVGERANRNMALLNQAEDKKKPNLAQDNNYTIETTIKMQ